MDFVAKGQLSALILTSLLERDMYGLEIIQDVIEKSGGEVIIKQPSLYSNLKRMEQLGYISSYWKDSEIGGKRHYYSITDYGRKQAREMQFEINSSHSKVKKLLSDDKEEKDTITVLKQENLFDLQDNKKESKTIKEEKASDPNFMQYDIFSKETEPAVTQPEPPKIVSDAVFLTPSKEESKPYVSSKMMDFSKELKNLKKRKSFADDQIEMVVDFSGVDPIKKEQHKEIIKDTVVKARETSYENFAYEDLIKQPKLEKETVAVKPEDDDGIFITESPDPEKLPKVRKIQPARLNIDNEALFPAPNRNLNYEPAYKEMIGSLYETTKANETSTSDDFEAYSDYNELSRYYKSQGITFKQYNKSEKAKSYNTNYINFLKSLFSTLTVCGVCILCFSLFFGLGLTYSVTNFLYILVPVYMIMQTTFVFYKYKTTDSKPPKQPFNIWLSIVISIVLFGAILGLNMLCGMTITTIISYANSFIFPSVLLICIPINCLISNILNKKIKV